MNNNNEENIQRQFYDYIQELRRSKNLEYKDIQDQFKKRLNIRKSIPALRSKFTTSSGNYTSEEIILIIELMQLNDIEKHKLLSLYVQVCAQKHIPAINYLSSLSSRITGQDKDPFNLDV